jgi:hypothetical protein
MRIYRPGKSVLNGTYKLPDAVPVQWFIWWSLYWFTPKRYL